MNAVVSYRSVPRILDLFNNHSSANLNWIPHFTSIINWTLRVGLGLMNQVCPTIEPWIAIIDHSIDIGTKKALVVLRVKMDALLQRGSAIQLKDCECVGLKICETVNGDTVATDLSDIFEKSGLPNAIIKDCDATLQKFEETTQLVSQVMEIFKNKGLTKTSYELCQQLSTEFPENSKVKKRL